VLIHYRRVPLPSLLINYFGPARIGKPTFWPKRGLNIKMIQARRGPSSPKTCILVAGRREGNVILRYWYIIIMQYNATHVTASRPPAAAPRHPRRKASTAPRELRAQRRGERAAAARRAGPAPARATGAVGRPAGRGEGAGQLPPWGRRPITKLKQRQEKAIERARAADNERRVAWGVAGRTPGSWWQPSNDPPSTTHHAPRRRQAPRRGRQGRRGRGRRGQMRGLLPLGVWPQ
jgi:hypothetical protein